MPGRNRIATCLLLSMLAAGCGRSGLGWFGWASVPACQTAIRARAVSEFGHEATIDFEGVAREKRIGNGRVRVTGRALVRHGKQPTALRYECETQPRRSRLLSATYEAD